MCRLWGGSLKWRAVFGSLGVERPVRWRNFLLMMRLAEFGLGVAPAKDNRVVCEDVIVGRYRRGEARRFDGKEGVLTNAFNPWRRHRVLLRRKTASDEEKET